VVASQENGITDKTRLAFTLNVTISAVVAALGVACSPFIAAVFNAESHAGLFAVIFLYPLFRGACQVNDAVLKRDLRYRRRTVVDLTRAAVRVAVSIPLAFTLGGPMSIAAGIIVSELAAMLLLWLLVPIRPLWTRKVSAVSDLLRFGGQVAVIRILGSFRGTFDYMVVGAAIGATALGYYGIAYKLPELFIENVLWIFTAIALPAYARARTLGHPVVIAAMLRATRLLTLYGLATGAALAVVARETVPLVFSDQWKPAILPMMLISLSLGIMSIAWASGDAFAALGRQSALVLLDVPATISMAAAFIYASRFGLVGVASVHLIFNVVYCVARMGLVQRTLAVPARSLATAVLPGAAVAAATAASGFLARSLLPSGEVLSLVVELATCAVTALGASLILARPAVIQLLSLVVSPRRERALT
jgi:lipopolysaccharide exporter